MSSYVKRTRGDHSGWVGPFRSHRQAKIEANAWMFYGWIAEVVEATPEVKAEVKAWEKAKATR